MEQEQESGTYCGIIEKQLITAICPLRAGRGCMWKHRESGRCMFGTRLADDVDEDMTMNEYATIVGLPPVDEALQPLMIRIVTERLRQEITE
ncbi:MULTISPECIES: hypothetical protein [Bacilli]|jgi:hypothetical protein|uniref:Uncharacterized protein n=5 Tax=root TaxID=1 RepID=A0A8S5UI83_9CAUD|nr:MULTISPECIES: hypothetical protein [Enterococcus]ELG7156215.1 hypothetical protein [Staphylococcus aureus]DAF94019.1 MAG TPA: hypothetical protein [Myoviridae sp. ctu2j3]HDW3906715.1 hypothetical protein [Escherichia coli]ELL1201294.1 hypothetical protein [Staphylococcus aureus]MDN3040804.1 hypothetical protein [Enterococcus faecium]